MGISRVLLKEMPLSRKPLVLAAHPNSFHSCALLLSPLASSHNTCKEAVLSIQTHYLFCFLSSLVMSYSALLWPFWFPRCLHFTSTFPVRGRKLQNTSAWSVWSIALALHRTCGQHKQDQSHEDPECGGWTEDNFNALLELDPLFQFRPCQNNRLFWKTPNAQFLLIKFLKLKFSQSFIGQITNLN